jgi:multiple sugar transport system permease protein
MNRRSRRRLIGIAYLAPALLFVLAFTVYPLGQMIWMSLHNWSLIAPPRFVGLANYERAFGDRQFWVSFVFTLKYTALITPVLIVGGYLLALLTAQNSPLRRFTRTVVFIPVVIGLGVSSLLWYWLFSTDFGLVNRALIDLGLVSEPVLWLGVDADRSNWAIIISVVWKVIGFGMILFVGAIQAIPSDAIEAAVVDGASYRLRLFGVILPLTLRTILLVTLVSVIGSLLAFDQFYIMTAGQPQNETATSVFYVYLNSFPYLKLGYGAALSLVLAGTILAGTIVQLVLTRRSQA